jgi:hypothetical protein
MKKFIKTITSVAIFCTTVAIIAAFNYGAAPKKVNVCHTPPGNPENCHEITISIEALPAHLEHGDDMVCHHPEELPVYESLSREYPATGVIVAF